MLGGRHFFNSYTPNVKKILELQGTLVVRQVGGKIARASLTQKVS